jgi:hypothetical protein
MTIHAVPNHQTAYPTPNTASTSYSVSMNPPPIPQNFAPIGGNSGLGISGVQFEERQVMSERTGGEKRVDSKLGDDEGVF